MGNIKSKLLAMLAIAVLTMGTIPAWAYKDGERVRFVGSVSAIDVQGQNFTVTDRDKNTTVIYVNPATEFEIEKGKDFLGDDDIPFTGLKVGDWVKVKSDVINGKLEASDVDIYR